MKRALAFILLLGASCKQQKRQPDTLAKANPSVIEKKLSETVYQHGGEKIQTGNTTVEQLLRYAKTLIGTPYKWGSINPKAGFDCSGFITHVFNHFNIKVPRSSREYSNINRAVDLYEARPGDIILFTGTDHTVRQVGHMGLVTANDNGRFEFIHSSSGKAHGVTLSPLSKRYMARFMKIVRVFRDNNSW